MGRETREADGTQLPEDALLRQYEVYIVGLQQVERGKAGNGGKKFFELAVTYLSTVEPHCRLDQPIQDVIGVTLNVFPPSKAVDAFIHMENYALNLLEMPWKTEFHTIVMYSGFYKIKIENQLQNAEKLFNLLGYQKQHDCLHLISIPTQHQIKHVALNFRLASVECGLISNIQRVLNPLGVSLSLVFQYRQEVKGDESKCAEYVRDNLIALKNKLKAPDYGIITYSKPKSTEGEYFPNSTPIAEYGKFFRSGAVAGTENPANVPQCQNKVDDNSDKSESIYYGFPLAAAEEHQQMSLKVSKEKKAVSPSKVKPMIWDSESYAKEGEGEIKNPSFSTFKKEKIQDHVGTSTTNRQQKQLHTGTLTTELSGRTKSIIPLNFAQTKLEESGFPQSIDDTASYEAFSEANLLDEQEIPRLRLTTLDSGWRSSHQDYPYLSMEQSAVGDFDEMAAILKDLDPDKLTDPVLRRQIKARLDQTGTEMKKSTFAGIGEKPDTYQSWQSSKVHPPVSPNSSNSEPLALPTNRLQHFDSPVDFQIHGKGSSENR